MRSGRLTEPLARASVGASPTTIARISFVDFNLGLFDEVAARLGVCHLVAVLWTYFYGILLVVHPGG